MSSDFHIRKMHNKTVQIQEEKQVVYCSLIRFCVTFSFQALGSRYPHHLIVNLVLVPPS